MQQKIINKYNNKWINICKQYYLLYLSELEKYRYNECHGGC